MTSTPRSARAKIVTLDQLSAQAAEARAAGQPVVLAHGVFDLLHMGHVRHLEAARREGAVLMVTLTADAFVNKGPGRPVFPEQLRAEMVAALECVDWVCINHAATAEPVLQGVRPSVYVKGSDYQDAGDDVTGKIVAERQAVEAHGGRIVFTDDITFSSSALINKHLNIYEPTLRQYLDGVREGDGLARLTGIIERVAGYRVLFVGDAIVDEYQYVLPMGKSPKENMIATLYQQHELFAGGVFAAANHAASFCRQVDVISCLGAADSHEEMIRASLRPNVGLEVLHRPDAPTTRKCRFIDVGVSMKKLFEVYFMDDQPLPGPQARQLEAMIAERAGDYDLVVVTDFGHGLLGRGAIRQLTERAPFLAVNAQSNSANHGFNLITKWRRADYICIDGAEARLAAQDKHADLSEIVETVLPEAIDCSNIVVTQGKHGCLTFRRDSGLQRVPALTGSIVDTVGAGDAFFAVSAPMVRAGASMTDIGLLGNAAGAIKVGIVGHRASVEKVAMIKFLTALLK